MRELSWREYARPIIARVLKQTAGQDEKAIRKALYEAYPFGERAMHPYKIWNSEVKRQRGLERDPQKRKQVQAETEERSQMNLF